jgi:GMP synthase-like glutamine amidotransferase
MKSLTVIQHTSADYLGLIEDHLEGRRIRFTYHRPFTESGKPPTGDDLGDGLVLLGGGPWGSAGTRDVPTLDAEITLARTALMLGLPVIGIGLGAQVLAIAADGRSETRELRFDICHATRILPGALNGYLPERFPNVTYMRDVPVPPAYARILAEDSDGSPAIFQIGDNVFGFTGHPGFKAGMAEDLIMEFEEAPHDTGPVLRRLRGMKNEIEDALVPIMTGIVQLTGLMQAEK